jgi:hypothetical protein
MSALVDLSAVELATGRSRAWIIEHGRAGWMPLVELTKSTIRVRRSDIPRWVAYSDHVRSWEGAPLTCPSEPTGAVYFVQALLDGRRAGPIKIGYSIRPRRRLAHLQIGCPVPLKTVAAMAGTRLLERRLHTQFWPWHSHGEWFYADAPGLREVIAFARKNPWRAPISLPEASHAA